MEMENTVVGARGEREGRGETQVALSSRSLRWRL